MVKISLLHPSYGRPQKAFEAFKEWESLANNLGQIEYIIGLDDNDPTLKQYMALPFRESRFARTVFSVKDTRNIVQVFNKFPTNISPSSNLFVGMADDMAPIKNWDIELYNVIPDMSKPAFVWVNDGQFPSDWPWSNYLIINRAFYEKVGYMLCPEYDGLSADVDIAEVAKGLNAVIDAKHLLFQHRHFCLGLSPMDSTYARHNNDAQMLRGKAIFESRKARNFDLKEKIYEGSGTCQGL
jgi:hypothetical protein